MFQTMASSLQILITDTTVSSTTGATDNFSKSGKSYLSPPSLTSSKDLWKTDYKRFHDSRYALDDNDVMFVKRSKPSLENYQNNFLKSSIQPYELANFQYNMPNRNNHINTRTLNKRYRHGYPENDKTNSKYRYYYIPDLIENITSKK